ncbi:hypothetical protein ANO11243_085650 [Dothideomycetidae sp. 11243]|nr:hypothetical protein ANO11243_085650 [fungal sp. No.11243]
MEDAISKKISELAASGWRPEEELAGLDVEGDGDEDDDAYAGVDLISHSDEDDTAIRKQEALSFREPEMSLVEQGDLARRLSLSDAGSDMMEWNGFDDMDNDHAVTGFGRFLDYDESRPASFLLADDEDSSFPREPKFGTDNPRKVRFQDEIDGSDGDSSDEEEMSETFPDIFTDTPQFTPSFQRTNPDEMYIDDGSDAGSVWDFEGDEPHLEDEEDDEEEDDWSESDGSSSGYDSDDGETTDEEEPCPIPKRAMNDAADSADSPAKSEDRTPRATVEKVAATPANKRRLAGKTKSTKTSPDAGTPRLPTAGTFDMDPTRNVLLVDGAGASQRNTLYPARIQTAEQRRYWQKMHQAYQKRTSMPLTSVQMSPADLSDDFDPASPFFDSESPFDPFGSLLPGQIMGPPEAFLPFTSVDASGTVTEDTSMASGSDDEEDILEPFVNFDEGKEDDEDDSADTSDYFGSLTRTRSNTFPSTTSPAPVASSPATPSVNGRAPPSSPFGGDLFSHLSRSKGLVHSFRMNQHYAKHIASYAADPTVRYSTSEMNAMQTGRRKAANTPITPLRKKRGGSLSKIGKVDWSKGLGVEKMGPPPIAGRDGTGHFKRPSSSGSGIANGKKGPPRGLFR